MLLFTIGYVASGRINFNFFPQIEADDLVVNIEMPLGVPIEDTEKAIQFFINLLLFIMKFLILEAISSLTMFAKSAH